MTGAPSFVMETPTVLCSRCFATMPADFVAAMTAAAERPSKRTRRAFRDACARHSLRSCSPSIRLRAAALLGTARWN